jgi:hypothetical protein
LSACRRASSTSSGRRKRSEQEGEDHDHDRAAHELGQRELPAQENREQDPELDHELVEANSNAIAAEKSAPLRKIERASATAAYEHEDEAAPRPQAIASDLGESRAAGG